MRKDLDFEYPKNADQWWQMLIAYKQELRDLVGSYHPTYARYAPKLPITAPAAQQACDAACEEIEKETQEDPLVLFDRFTLEKDGLKLANLLNATWFGVPESMDAHSLPGFGVLCDLCSEAYVLEPEPEGDE